MKTIETLNRPEQAAVEAILNVWIEQSCKRNENLDSINLRKVGKVVVEQFNKYLKSKEPPEHLSKSELAQLVSRSKHLFY